MSKNYEFFLTLPRQEWKGEWVIVAGGTLIGHGKNPGQIMDEAMKRFPDDIPFAALIPGRETLHYHTWS